MRGERGEEKVKSAEWAVGREEKRGEPAVWQIPLRILAFIFTDRESSFPYRFSKIIVAAVFSDLENRRDARAPFSCVFENQDAPRRPNGERIEPNRMTPAGQQKRS